MEEEEKKDPWDRTLGNVDIYVVEKEKSRSEYREISDILSQMAQTKDVPC